ncbi:SCO7613 C-terminal domain-containing membrane protein [Paractinoplanes brasiliensis]|uniref:Uncharacterized protein n=1 Tax=Paractinoplanes brasiliensis TaxID=52695 RepID=A0A4R6JRC9_9ACTN|nr:hypothetical protein [Actinoplanes brasiliensis]TDO37466.1 hypothetical protein C8E87_1094 [Actinoplanes brasiliensis]GID29215.1 hypothetical protein Abr02nite_41980 [Actinoplanes brasiliensis]
MTYPCPQCGTPASPESGCPSCGRGPDPDAIEVVRADAEIAELNRRLFEARRAVAGLEATLAQVWSRRQAAAARIQQRQPAPAPAGEASNRLVQTALFLIGGLLLAVAAIVFTAVAWDQFGVGGRAVVLAVVTGAALVVPFVALRRRLTATAETFAAIGLLLMLLDGYAAWHVNLFGVADGSAWGYAGAVCAVTAAVAVGYEHLTGLAGPRFAALVAAQPVIPLLVAAAEPGPAVWGFAFAAVGALNVAVLAVRRGGLGFAAVLAGSLAALAAAGSALVALFDTTSPGRAAGGGAALVTAALVVLAGALVASAPVARQVADGLLVVATAIAAGRVTVLLTPGGGNTLAEVALVLLVIAVLVVTVPRAGVGARIGAAATVLPPAAFAFGWAMVEAFRTLLVAHFDENPARAGWVLPVALALLGAAAVALVPAGRRVLVSLIAVALIAVTGLQLPWWGTPIVELVLVAVSLGVAVRFNRAAVFVALPLGAHAVATGLPEPGVAAGVFAAVAVLGCATATLTRDSARDPLHTGSLLVGLLAVPAAAWSGVAAFTTDHLPQMFAVLAVSALVTALRRPAAEVAAHTGAAIALVLAATGAGAGPERAAIVFALWGLVLAIRARQRGYLLAAVASEVAAGVLVAAGNGVTTLEAYTVPAAAVALLAGVLFGRGRSSWVAYGPALVAALLPSLASVLAGDGQHLRRLLLGVAAVAVVVAGAVFKLRAPVLVGGGVLVVLALHELAQFWDLIPRWIPLAVAGLLLVVIATTIERRRRDLRRVRTLMQRMS